MNKRRVSKPIGPLYSGRPGYALTAAEPPAEKPKHSGMAMSVEDMAEELAISKKTAYRIARLPGFPSFTIGRRVLVSREGLQQWINIQCRTSRKYRINNIRLLPHLE